MMMPYSYIGICDHNIDAEILAAWRSQLRVIQRSRVEPPNPQNNSLYTLDFLV